MFVGRRWRGRNGLVRGVAVTLLGAWAVGAVSGCLGGDLVPCESGIVCSPDKVCDDIHGACVLPSLFAAKEWFASVLAAPPAE